VEVRGRDTPVESLVGAVGFGAAAPEDPGGEDSVKEGLNECGAEKVIALVALELEAEGLFECLLDGAERGEGVVLCSPAGFAGVGGEEPGEVAGVGDGRLADEGRAR
jgi:hypothetical protein